MVCIQAFLEFSTGKLDSAIEEMLRWVTPVRNMNRTATRDTTIGGQRIREGDRMLLLYPSGNRDERVFEDPFRFDVTREPNDHLAFGGSGTHFCRGASLARSSAASKPRSTSASTAANAAGISPVSTVAKSSAWVRLSSIQPAPK